MLMCWIRAETELNYKMAPIARSFDVGGGGIGAEVEARRDKERRGGGGPLCSGQRGRMKATIICSR